MTKDLKDAIKAKTYHVNVGLSTLEKRIATLTKEIREGYASRGARESMCSSARALADDLAALEVLQNLADERGL